MRSNYLDIFKHLILYLSSQNNLADGYPGFGEKFSQVWVRDWKLKENNIQKHVFVKYKYNYQSFAYKILYEILK